MTLRIQRNLYCYPINEDHRCDVMDFHTKSPSYKSKLKLTNSVYYYSKSDIVYLYNSNNSYDSVKIISLLNGFKGVMLKTY